MKLIKPGWMSKSEQKALKAVNKLSDPLKLSEAAINSPHEAVNLAALGKLTDDEWLIRITAAPACLHCKSSVQQAALQKMTDAGLHDLTRSQYCSVKVLEDAVGRIKDISLLEDIIQTSKRSSAVEAACERLGGHQWTELDVCHQRCSRCGKEIEHLDSMVAERVRAFSQCKTSDEWWTSRGGYTRHSLRVDREPCPVCGCVTPHTVHVEQSIVAPTTTYSRADKQIGIKVTSECVVCNKIETRKKS